MSERKTQAQWDAERAKVKAKAAKTIKSNEAKAKKARDKALGIKPKASTSSEVSVDTEPMEIPADE